MKMVVEPRKSLRGRVSVPGDKSISHRAVMLGAIAGGTTEIDGFLAGADCLSTIACFRSLGVDIDGPRDGRVVVRGRGLDGLAEPGDVLDVGNSGTTIRLLSGILAGQRFYSVLTGDSSIRRRPMDRVTGPLRRMGAVIHGRRGGSLAPLTIVGGELKGIEYETPVASAQIKSAVLLAGLYADGSTTVREPQLSRDHTERMLSGFGATVRVEDRSVTVQPRPRLEGRRVVVPGDISSAAFLMVAALICPGSEVIIEGVGVNPTRTGVIDMLRTMGADIQILNQRHEAGEPVGDLIVRSSGLAGTTISGDIIPRAIDEIPAIAVAALYARGSTVIRDARELRVKETDRIAVLARELRKMGGQVEELEDGMVIEGGRPLRGAPVDSHGDHRLAMSLAVAGLQAGGRTEISATECIDVSFPGFEQLLHELY